MSRRSAILIPVLLVLVTGATRLMVLDEPGRIIFDETYYVNDARDYLDRSVEDGFAVHPPVGKWIIAAGITVFGDNPFGWRVMGALAGTLLVLFVYLIGARLLRWRGAAALAALLVVVDGLMFVQARTAMLDIYLGLFVVLGAWLLLVDFDRSGLGEDASDLRRRSGQQLALPVQAGGSSDEPPDKPPDKRQDKRPDEPPNWERTDREVADVAARDRRREERLDHVPDRGHAFRAFAGVAFGLAIATKWSGVLALGAAGLVVLGWELAWRRRLIGEAFLGFWRIVRSGGVTLVLIPLAVYGLSYVPWLVNFPHTSEGEKVCTTESGEIEDPCHVGLPDRIEGLAKYHVAVFNFHNDLEADHPYRAPAYTWMYLGRPVVYYWNDCEPDDPTEPAEGEEENEPEIPCETEANAAEIINLGNPALWVFAGLALVPLGLGMLAGDRRAWYLFAFFGAQFIPWLIVDRPVFFFYMTPVVPFMTLIVAFGVIWIDEFVIRRALARGRPLPQTRATPGAITGATVAVVCIAMFLYFYPVYAGIELDQDLIRQRWWVNSWI